MAIDSSKDKEWQKQMEVMAKVYQEEENKMNGQFDRIYQNTENFGRVQFVKEIQMQINENKDLKKQLEAYEKENQRLINVLNELEEELEQEYAVNKTNSIEEYNNPEWYIKWNCYKNVLNKLKELKERINNGYI